MYSFLTENKLLNPHNSGFHYGDGTVSQLLSITHKLTEALDDGKDVRIVFLDLSMAFDKVSHKGVLFKLKRKGISGNLLKWISSYLHQRVQCVVLDGHHSETLPVDDGVPQGFILGPLLFLVHLDDMVINLACAIRLYADDACLIEIVDLSPAVSATKIHTESLLNWSIQWLMMFNALKSLALTLTRKRKLLHHPHLTINGVILEEVNQHCHLGLVINTSSTWENHINYIRGKVGKIVNIMRCLKYTLPRKALERLFINRIRTIIEYADVIYDNCPKYLADRLEGVQMEAARICTGGMRQTSSEKLLLELGGELLFKRRKWHKLIYMFKIVHGLSPLYLSQICQPTASSTRYATRSANNIRVPRCRTSYFKIYFFLHLLATGTVWITVFETQIRYLPLSDA